MTNVSSPKTFPFKGLDQPLLDLLRRALGAPDGLHSLGSRGGRAHLAVGWASFDLDMECYMSIVCYG